MTAFESGAAVASVLDMFLVFLTLVVGVWIALFGTTCALLAPRAGMSRISGFTIGAVSGPIGIVVMLWKGRDSTNQAAPIEESEWDDSSTMTGGIA